MWSLMLARTRPSSGPPHNGCIGGRAGKQDSSFQARFPSVALSAPPNLIIQWQTSQQHVGGSCSPANQSPVPQAPGEEGLQPGWAAHYFPSIVLKFRWPGARGPSRPRCFSSPAVYLTSRNLTQPGAESLVTCLPTGRCQDVESYHWKELLVCDCGPHRFYTSCTVGNDIGAP